MAHAPFPCAHEPPAFPLPVDRSHHPRGIAVSNSRAARRRLGRIQPTGAGLTAARHARAVAASAATLAPAAEQVSNRPW